MKKYLILGLMLTLAVPALAWLPTWMNATGTGLWTVDSLYAIYGGRIGSGYSLKFGAVSVKDTLTTMLRLPSVNHIQTDTVWFQGARTGRYLTGNGAGNYLGTDYFRAENDIIAPSGLSNCGPIVGSGSSTITGFSKISNSSTVGIKVASDSLIITPEGGIAVLMQCKDADSALMRGNPVSFTGPTAKGVTRSATAKIGLVYSDSIARNGGWGFVTVSGIGYAAWAVNTLLANGGIGGTGTKRRLVAESGPSYDGNYICQVIDTVKTVNAIGDSISRVLLINYGIPSSP
jgi:hypothetical protein